MASLTNILAGLSELKAPPSPQVRARKTHHIGCERGLKETFSLLVSAAQVNRPELPVIVISGSPGAGKTSTTAALMRYLSQQGVPHQVIPADMFASPNGKKQLAFGLQIAACSLAQPLMNEPLRCFIGKKSLRISHEFRSVQDLVRHLDTMTLPYTVQASMPKYGHVELLPKRLTIVEGYAASLMVGPLPGAQHCFVDTPHTVAETRYRARHADDRRQNFRAGVRSLFLHSSWIETLINSQAQVADFILRYDGSFDVRSAFKG